ncbi:hypothetical protein BBJ28_00015455 [Nothophytophthora sp. Chile5]|nr:hypothetical protein BBJ28_00015455 [Nothophytophthora sp. Chile5]
MGNLLSSLFDRLRSSFDKRKSSITIIGLDAAGKTTLLYRMKLGEVILTMPTIGYNVETFQYKNIKFTAWDIGGNKHTRRWWQQYIDNIDAVIFVVDATDHERVDEAKQALHLIFEAEELSNTKLLVYANKQDQPGAMSAEELQEKLELSEATKNPTRVQTCIATTGEGVYAGLDWLSKALCDKFRLVSGMRKTRIGIVGLDFAGKTTLLYKIKQGDVVTTIPTIGFQIKSFEYKNIRCSAWDIGSDNPRCFRVMWHRLLMDCDAVVFVVDATDRDRIEHAKHELHLILANEELGHQKLLVLANKQDLPSAMSIEEVQERLELSEAMTISTHVQPCVAATGQGVYEGLDWLGGTMADTLGLQRSVLAATYNQAEARQAPGRITP